MKKIQTVYQVVFVMFDGAELTWKIFSRVEHYHAYVAQVTPESMRSLGVASIRYRTMYIE
jgi:hypothetical protein